MYSVELPLMQHNLITFLCMTKIYQCLKLCLKHYCPWRHMTFCRNLALSLRPGQLCEPHGCRPHRWHHRLPQNHRHLLFPLRYHVHNWRHWDHQPLSSTEILGIPLAVPYFPSVVSEHFAKGSFEVEVVCKIYSHQSTTDGKWLPSVLWEYMRREEKGLVFHSRVSARWVLDEWRKNCCKIWRAAASGWVRPWGIHYCTNGFSSCSLL